MPSQIRKRQHIPEQADYPRQPKPRVSDCRIPLVVLSRDFYRRRPRLPDHGPVDQQLLALAPRTARMEPEEVLIADARNNVTPAQMVERKLMALVRDVGSGVSVQRTDRPADLRGRTPCILLGAQVAKQTRPDS
jgi:hypothetical protein